MRKDVRRRAYSLQSAIHCPAPNPQRPRPHEPKRVGARSHRDLKTLAMPDEAEASRPQA